MDSSIHIYVIAIFLTRHSASATEVLQCEDIPDLEGGRVEYIGSVYSSVICQDSYCRSPDIGFSECIDEVWVPSPPKCYKLIEVQCSNNSQCSTTEALCQDDSVHIKCNDGYELYSQEANRFLGRHEVTVSNDRGMAVIENSERVTVKSFPICVEERCQISLDIDINMIPFVLIKGRLAVLSGGAMVESGENVFLNCMRTKHQVLEPVNRRFECQNGIWSENDDDWELGINGTFPTCRNVSCDSICQNGGECIRDNTCRCPYLTTGLLCENFLCDDQCELNGGECVAPGKCGNCSAGQYGDNCEKRGCWLPVDEHRLAPNETWVEAGSSVSEESITCSPGYRPSSVDGMTCMDAGEWSQLVQCEEIREIRYRVEMKTGSQYTASTTAEVYIYLHDGRHSSKKLVMKNRPKRGEFIKEEFTDENLVQLKYVRVGRESVVFPDDWQLEYVAVTDLTRGQFYWFKKRFPVWIDDDTDETIPLFG